jgi:formylglycine-generating enzyme required for sulfatase activity
MRSIVLGTLLAFGVAQGAEPKIVKNGIGMELIEIPAGKFTMGSPSDEKGRESDEESVRVTLTRPFLLGRTEVTQGQWKQVMNSEPWKKQTVFEVDDDYPATSITFFDAVKFCDKLTELEREKRKEPASLHYRLPTEAEWEYACRAGTTTAFSFDKEADINSYAWIKRWDGPAARQPFGHKVAQKMPNSWGLHDMHGNVFEWCSDWYDKKLMGGVDPVGPPHGAYRTSRGGGWWDYPIHYRSAYRFSFVPTREFERLGFRVAGYQPAE